MFGYNRLLKKDIVDHKYLTIWSKETISFEKYKIISLININSKKDFEKLLSFRTYVGSFLQQFVTNVVDTEIIPCL